MAEQWKKSMEARVNANPKWFFPFLRKEQRSTFIQEIEIKHRWHEVNQYGQNTALFEIMCLKDFKEQFLLYRKYRPFKYPEDFHALDSALARRHNNEML
jgi:hypothetical protein